MKGESQLYINKSYLGIGARPNSRIRQIVVVCGSLEFTVMETREERAAKFGWMTGSGGEVVY